MAEIVDMLERAGPLVRGASEVIARRLNAIAAQGETCLKRGEIGEAVIVFSTLGAGICVGYEMIWDEESEVGMVLDRCVEGLEACLNRASTSTRASATCIRAFGERLKAAGKPFKVIMTACMRKLLVILNAIVATSTAWSLPP